MRPTARNSMAILSVVISALLVGLSGCVEPQSPRIGIIEQEVPGSTERIVGNHAPDFAYRNDHGERVTFSETRGDITILVFPVGEGWPDCERCEELQEIAHRLTRVCSDVVVVSVFVPDDSCAARHHQMKNCHIEGFAGLITLCDAEGCVRDMYGPKAEGHFFIVDADGQLAGTGPITDLESLEKQTRKAVYRHEDYCHKMYGPQEIDRPY